jgi:hypothetical protein
MPSDFLRSRLATIVMLAATFASLQGCVTQPSSQECAAESDPEIRANCLDRVMYGGIARGAAFGAAVGAVLGGAVGFATTRSVSGIVRAVVLGGMVGGVAGGVAAYLQDLQARTAGDLQRQASKNAADLANFNRKNALLFESIILLLKKKSDQDSLMFAKLEAARAEQVVEVHTLVANTVGLASDTFEELRKARDDISHLKATIADQERLIRAMPPPDEKF